MGDLWIVIVIAFAIPLVTMRYVRRFALARQLMDVPNARSSHALPTPRGGGVAIVISFVVSAGVSVFWGVAEKTLLEAIMPAVLLVAFVGFVDDLRDVPASARILVHIAAIMWAVFWLRGELSIPLPSGDFVSGWLPKLFAIFTLVWLLNLFNFMDGIDGIATAEAIFVSCSGMAIAFFSGQSVEGFMFAAIGAAALGFLPWNWPPARIFMGDVGSGFLGASLGILSYSVALENSLTLWVWPILFAVFVTDSTITLIRRFLNGQQWYEPHRSHAYQRLARRWGHLKVTLVVTAINVCWLIPMAILAFSYPHQGALITMFAYTPLVILILGSGAGKHESVL